MLAAPGGEGGAGGGYAVYHSEKLPGSCPLYDLALDPLEATAVAMGQDGVMRFWEVATGAPAGTMAPGRGAREWGRGGSGRIRVGWSILC